MDTFNLETTSVWSFKERGAWSTHKGNYPGNCSPKVIKNLILKYSNSKDIVLDQFIGSGTCAIESLLLGRRIIGIDINPKAISITLNRIRNLSGESQIKLGNAEKLFLQNNSVDFICTHPPYLDIIKYSNNINGDLSLLSKCEFYNSIRNVAMESYRVLKPGKKCAIIVGDARKKGYIEPIGFSVMDRFLSEGFLLKEIIIKEQHNCKSTEKWREIAFKRNFLLIKHEYIFVFEKNSL